MSEDQVKRIACDLVAQLELDPCKLESVQRLSGSQPSNLPTTEMGEWVGSISRHLNKRTASLVQVKSLW